MNIREMIAAILALLCFGYSAVIYRVHAGTATFVLWIVLGVFLLCCAAGLHFHVWALLPVWLRRVIFTTAAVVIALFTAVEGCIISGFGAKGEDVLQSLNTVENITNSSAYFDKETARVGIVTSNFHVFRGVHIAGKLGIKSVCGIAAPVVPLYLPNNMLREFFGVVKDFVCGNL